MIAVLSAVAYGLLGIALSIGNGFFHPIGLALVLATLALVVYTLRAPWSASADDAARAWLGVALAAVAAIGLAGLIARRPGIALPPGTSLAPYRAGLVAAALVALAYSGGARCLPRLRFPLAVALYVTLGAWVVHATPAPGIDVWHAQQRAVALFLAGENPYTAYYPNVYDGTGLYGPGAFRDGQLYSFTYPPLVILLGIPGWLIGGDVRLSLVGAIAGAACLAVAAGRRLGLAAGHVAELAPIALLFHPRGYFLVEQAWVDPYMALGAAAVTWALAGRRPWATRLALGAYLTAKQHACLWLVPLLASRRVRWRDAAWGIVAAAAICAPFAAWGPDGFWRGVVLIQLTSPFRRDSLSVLPAVHALTGIALPSAVSFAAAALAALATIAWRRGRPGEAALGGAAIYVAFFAFAKQAFLNYYWLAGAFLVLAIVEASAPARDDTRAR